MRQDTITIELTRDGALVLFDWIKRFGESEHNSFEDQAEERVLWDIEAVLETNLSGPLRADYVGLLAAARSRVRDADR